MNQKSSFRIAVLSLLAIAPGFGATLKNQMTLSGTRVTGITGIAVDPQGFIYIVGTTSWPQFPTTPGPLSHYSGDGGFSNLTGDVFVQKLTPQTFKVVYSVLVGGSGDETSTAIAVDSQGNVYVTGYTDSADFPVTIGKHPQRNPDTQDSFVFKLDPTGTKLVFSEVIGGSGSDYALGIAVGPDGSVSIAGQTDSNDFPLTANAIQTVSLGTDAFVVRLSPDGATILYATYLGGPGGDCATGIAVDGNGDLYVTGSASSYFPTFADSLYPNLIQGGFVSKIDHTTGQLAYSTYIPGVFPAIVSQFEFRLSICVDAQGRAYITGGAGADFPTTPGAFQTDYANGLGPLVNGNDAFLLELDAAGKSIVFATFIGGSSDDSGIGVTLSGNSVVITGTTNSIDFPVTDYSLPTCNFAAYLGPFSPPKSAFVSSFDHTGKLLNSTTYSFACLGDQPTAIAAGSSSVFLADMFAVDRATTLVELDLTRQRLYRFTEWSIPRPSASARLRPHN